MNASEDEGSTDGGAPVAPHSLASRAPSVAAPDLSLEREAWRAGARWVAGVDEVGRGALAGPVVVGAVILPASEPYLADALARVRDSKQLDPRARCGVCADVLRVAVGASVGAVGPLAVDALGIVPALCLAVRRALRALPVRPDLVLVDGLPLPGLRDQRAVVRGDETVLSIACASVLAKTYRDAAMISLSLALPAFGLDAHKGYATAGHRAALADAGPTALHRLSWAPVAQALRGRSNAGDAADPAARAWGCPAPRVRLDGAAAYRVGHP